jgi:hypothetical protein
MTPHDRCNQKPYQDEGKELATDNFGEITGNGDAKRRDQGKKQGMAEAAVAEWMGVRKPA